MKQRARIWMTIALVLLLAGITDADARRSRRRGGLGGDANRARGRGEALAQRFYEQAVSLGKQQQYGQAASLMKRAVEKNASNEKYRYYLSLLLYKRGDYGEAQQHLKRLRRGKIDRYRKKAVALTTRIDKVLRGEVEIIRQPARQPGNWKTMDVLPSGAYVNVAGEAARISAGVAPPVTEMHGPVMNSTDYKNARGRQVMVMMSRPTPASTDVEAATPPSMSADIEATAGQAVDRAEDAYAEHMRPIDPVETPPQVEETADEVDMEHMRPIAAPLTTEPAAPVAVASTAKSKDEFAEDAFGDDFEDSGFDQADESNEPPEDNPFLEDGPEASEPAQPASPAATTAPATDEFSDFGEDGFDDMAPEPAAPAAAPADGEDEFGEFDEDVFEEF